MKFYWIIIQIRIVIQIQCKSFVSKECKIRFIFLKNENVIS